MEITFKLCLLFKTFIDLIKVFETTQNKLTGVGSNTNIIGNPSNDKKDKVKYLLDGSDLSNFFSLSSNAN